MHRTSEFCSRRRSNKYRKTSNFQGKIQSEFKDCSDGDPYCDPWDNVIECSVSSGLSKYVRDKHLALPNNVEGSGISSVGTPTTGSARKARGQRDEWE